MMIREGRRGAGRLRKDGGVLSAQAGAAQGQRTGTYIRNHLHYQKRFQFIQCFQTYVLMFNVFNCFMFVNCVCYLIRSVALAGGAAGMAKASSRRPERLGQTTTARG